jgi:hypothetical protein
MLYWECGHRLKRLKEFRALLDLYFETRGHMEGLNLPFETEQSSEARSKINEHMGDIRASCNLIGHRWIAQPGQIDMLVNTFNLQAIYVEPRALIDSVERTIGDYERLRHDLFWQLFNPFYWLGKLVGIPFRVFTAVGFEGDRWERSVIGRLFKLFEWVAIFVGFVAAILTIRADPKFMDGVSRTLHALFHR